MTKLQNFRVVLSKTDIIYGLIFVLITLSFGLYFSVSVEGNSWTAFSRSGCIITCIALALMYRDWTEDIKAAQAAREAILKYIPKGSKIGNSNQDFESALRQVWSDIDSNLSIQNRYKRNIEFFFAIAGSLIWGFGDLTPLLLNNQ